jgi:hypothetical protein
MHLIFYSSGIGNKSLLILSLAKNLIEVSQFHTFHIHHHLNNKIG